MRREARQLTMKEEQNKAKMKKKMKRKEQMKSRNHNSDDGHHLTHTHAPTHTHTHARISFYLSKSLPVPPVPLPLLAPNVSQILHFTFFFCFVFSALYLACKFQEVFRLWKYVNAKKCQSVWALNLHFLRVPF